MTSPEQDCVESTATEVSVPPQRSLKIMIDRVPDLQRDESLSSEEDLSPALLMDGSGPTQNSSLLTNVALTPGIHHRRRRRIGLVPTNQKNEDEENSDETSQRYSISPRKLKAIRLLSPTKVASAMRRDVVGDLKETLRFDGNKNNHLINSDASPRLQRPKSLNIRSRSVSEPDVNHYTERRSLAMTNNRSPVFGLGCQASPRNNAASNAQETLLPPTSDGEGHAAHSNMGAPSDPEQSSTLKKDRRGFGILPGRVGALRDAAPLPFETVHDNAHAHVVSDTPSSNKRRALTELNECGKKREERKALSRSLPLRVDEFVFRLGRDSKANHPSRESPNVGMTVDVDLDQTSASSDLSETTPNENVAISEKSFVKSSVTLVRSCATYCFNQFHAVTEQATQNNVAKKTWFTSVDIFLYLVGCMLQLASIVLMTAIDVSCNSMLWLFNQPVFRHVVVFLVKITSRQKVDQNAATRPDAVQRDDSAKYTLHPLRKKPLWFKMKAKRPRKQCD